jgi:general stress protein YciG
MRPAGGRAACLPGLPASAGQGRAALRITTEAFMSLDPDSFDSDHDHSATPRLREPSKPLRGFARLDPERQREIARQGGRAAHAMGRAHEFTAEEGRRARAKGRLPRESRPAAR